ncbi:MFS transporter [Roseiconus lacunae]|uniref:MFS transporter n=1 Tax=Roseiconus lacunae TaxID=2605694 RepID=A0ABT7PPD0_9BACT|nr:MFS transporter [Roseiconus lacunae]MDM4018321.1 MFS transporter [Roseiconus lacunae]
MERSTGQLSAEQLSAEQRRELIQNFIILTIELMAFAPSPTVFWGGDKSLTRMRSTHDFSIFLRDCASIGIPMPMNFLSDQIAKHSRVFYGYWMLPLAMLLQIGSSPGQTFAVSAFTPALLDAIDLTQSRLGLAYMLGTLLAAIPLTSIGPASDRIGLKRIACFVILGLAAACLFASTVTSFLGLLAAFFFLRFLGQGSMSLLSNNTTAMWFRTRIGRVSALLSIGSAVAFAWVPDWLSTAIETIGWRSTYRWIAVILVVFLFPVILLLYRNRPEDLGQSVDGIMPSPHPETIGATSVVHVSDDVASKDDRSQAFGDSDAGQPGQLDDVDGMQLADAIRTVSYYVIGLSNIVWAMAGTGVLFYLFTLCAERGLDKDDAKTLFKILGFSMLGAQLCGGVLGDYLRLNRLFGIGTSMIALSLIWLRFDHSLLGAKLFAMLFGGGQGMLISVTGVIMVRYYGRRHLGSIRGAIWCGTVAGSGCGPLLMGAFMDRTGAYDPAIACFATAMLPLAVAAWFIHPPQLTSDGEGAKESANASPPVLATTTTCIDSKT